MASRGADVAHVPYWGPPLTCPRPVVVTVHDTIPVVLPGYAAGWTGRAYFAVAAAGARGAAAVLVDSHTTRRDVVDRLGVDEDRVHVVPLGVSPDFLNASQGRPGGVGLPPNYGLYLGGFDPRKRVEILAAAWPRVFAATGLPLVVAGVPPVPTGLARDGVRALRRGAEETPSAFRLVGEVPASDLPALYAGATVFAYPSRYEGFGLPPLEAMAVGTPVVATAGTSVEEVVADAGVLLSAAAGPSDWATALVRLIEDPEQRRRLISAGRTRATTFTWARCAAAVRDIYTRVAGGAEPQ
jgi:glycosyltransferase involved in cell wall biosynthesis